MNKNDFIASIAEKTGLTKKDCNNVWNAAIETLVEEMNKETETRVVVPGFGTIKVKVREEYNSLNPRTGEVVKVPTRRVARLTLSNSVKKQLIQE